MHDLIPNHSFPWGCSNLKWGLKGQLYQSPGLHPFFSSFFFPFLTTACSVNGSGPCAFQPLQSDQRFILSILCHKKRRGGGQSLTSLSFSQFLFILRDSLLNSRDGGEGGRKGGGWRETEICYVVNNYWLHLLDLQYHRN